MRDLCRARADLVDDRDRARKRLGAFLLRHARVFRGGSYWTVKHDQWLTAQRFDERALGETFGHYRAVLTARDAALAAVEADLKPWFDREPFVDCVHGWAPTGASPTWVRSRSRRRCATGAAFPGRARSWASPGWCPRNTPAAGPPAGGIRPCAGKAHLRTQLVESAWAYQHRPAVGAQLRHRQQGLDPQVITRAWKAQTRLCGRFRRMAQVKNTKSVVAAAIARELAGFVWAEMTAP